jgi:hypothetical protein
MPDESIGLDGKIGRLATIRYEYQALYRSRKPVRYPQKSPPLAEAARFPFPALLGIIHQSLSQMSDEQTSWLRIIFSGYASVLRHDRSAVSLLIGGAMGGHEYGGTRAAYDLRDE